MILAGCRSLFKDAEIGERCFAVCIGFRVYREATRLRDQCRDPTTGTGTRQDNPKPYNPNRIANTFSIETGFHREAF